MQFNLLSFYAISILDRIGPINVCADLVREFKAQEACSNGQFRFHPFAYDWRKEPESSSTALEAFLTDIYAKNGGQKITVIAHSMGGLIALSVVNRVPHLFKSVTFVGTPFGGVPLILWQLKRGTPFLAQRNLMTPDLHFGARTSFVFLPTDGKGLVVDGKNGEDDYLVDFYNADEWIRNTLSETLSETTAPETLTKHKNYLTTTLAAAKRFRQSLAYNPALQSHYPPFTHLISSKWPTATRIKCSIAPPPPTEPASTASTTTPTMKPPDRKIDLKYLWPTTFLPGDGVVTRTSMHMPAGFTCHEVESSVGHWAMMNDLRGVRACLKRVTGRVGGVGDAVTEAVKRVVDGGAMPVAPEEVPRSRPLEAAREQEEAGQHGSDAVSAQLAAEEEMIPPPHANESGDVSAEWQEIEAGTVPPAGTKLERESVQRVGQRLREAVSEEHLKGKVSVV
ncbi:Alpha/Beta hydrolase protein [Fimicolochytrium jonesii]|uniref:Alpha/Beta hydrolase protein n=1 Tax=Fimicolochytrium jonesii TaxID=1396493 RepID=UPI0022FDD39C|nr:Alpha/Beta hydrolase protein [Fimicolochytrium jonesii]KAI8825168.1 Alpha/Beta hydrolase protein [Fimicolochytrium jonesii]